MTRVVVFSKQKSARLSFVLDWLLKEVLHLDYDLVHDPEALPATQIFLSYGAHFPNSISVPDDGLLWERQVREQYPQEGTWENLPTLFHKETGCSLPFDLFSAVFFLLSRYEEYYPHTPDKHGRYPPDLSVLYRNELLERPIIDEWIRAFAQLLAGAGIHAKLSPFKFSVSYDIDIAFSYKHKGFVRTLGAFSKDILAGRHQEVATRMCVFFGKSPDPYDCFDWLETLHQRLGLHPFYFVLASLRTTPFDKNILPNHPAMHRLVMQFAKEGTVGMHPSYFSNDNQVFSKEKNLLEQIAGKDIRHSRQHYVRLQMPETYRKLISRGIKEDWSMGYGSKLGFRAGTGRSFFWYDVEQEVHTSLRIHPFCFMDSTAHFEERLDVEKAFGKLERMCHVLMQTSSQLITVFHNFSLGSDPQWAGWRVAYENYLTRLTR